MRPTTSVVFLAAAASAQSIIESSSFGLSPNRDTIPGWQIGGEGQVPQFLSDKLILTPPYPGNTRGFAWSQSPVSHSEWSVELQFRATGPERGGGNLQLWYAKDGQAKIGTSSIYTVGPFDGFALVIDAHGGTGGSIRGFLNDGSTDYRSHDSVDSLAFGHCIYSYRNLGRPSIIGIKHTNSIFEVTVDDKLCFSTDKISLPAGNTFGLTAATPENPDSFEIFKFILRSSETAPPVQQGSYQQPITDQNVDGAGSTGSESVASGAQLADLRARLELLSHASTNLVRDVNGLSSKSDSRHAELLQQVATKEQLASLDARLQRIEDTLLTIKRDLEGKDYRSHFNQLQETLKSSHLNLAENLQGTLHTVITSSAPRMGFFIFLIIAFQALLAGSYVIYKRRRANMPKKFL
ncbi:hypothetical protein MPDQ_007102 [Monascus purpureus]|uniref:L-type lectin-like domain-containing protein n=1 Tax=Monascus purpureus TaxID=5098 RepID=A0A507R6N4_MONPU|nr:hypothetical protein MPDQ_007102 [Monascus purpureus]BDD55306.1 hypothetical protein MAP00_000842 [Monascus purpureus]